MPDICFLDARELARLIRTRELSAHEVMRAHLARIARENPAVNAIVAGLNDEACLALADDADRTVARGEATGPLYGLPWAFKDLEDAVGFPNTRGSLIYQNFMPKEDTALVARLRAAGVIPIGKTNVPELGMGSHTYNKVYGVTRNPYDITKSAGGSSGGAAAALATGMLPLADGSDLGGSLRNPANFNNVVGFRPSPWIVPAAPTPFPFIGFLVKGPMARSVSEVAFLLSVMAADPTFADLPDRDLRGVRVAWSPDLGSLPLDPQVRAVLEGRRQTFEDLGCVVEDATPDLSGADDVFLTIRRWMSASRYGDLRKTLGGLMKPEAIEEIELGARLSGSDVARAMALQSDILERMRTFHATYEFLVCAVNQVPPFDVNLDWPKTIDGVRMERYTDWMKSAYWISVTFGPAISVPCGFTREGLPVGIQIVGRYQRDRDVLCLARAFEQAADMPQLTPR